MHKYGSFINILSSKKLNLSRNLRAMAKRINVTTLITEFLGVHPSVSSKEIHEGLRVDTGYATVKRTLQKMLADEMIIAEGNGKSTRYKISPAYSLLYPVDLGVYFKKEIDDRKVRTTFNHDIIPLLGSAIIFSPAEQKYLKELHDTYTTNIAKLSQTAYTKEMERFAIDLSWKSSQIEGNTYSLLETERLLKERQTASGKTQAEASMLLNHKVALDFINENPSYVKPLTIARIEDIHSMLMKDLNVDRNIRKYRVGISGTNYIPLTNDFQIREALEEMCTLLRKQDHVFTRALLALMLLSYIQAFEDGNKRTARIISNAILLSERHCPLSFRTVEADEYKKAMLVFYEQNNISACKKIFIQQVEFAVATYF